jgi:Skp family chaperone for outer membrane proteins
MRISRMIVAGMALAMLAGGASAAAQELKLKIAVLDIQRTLLAYERRATMRVERDRKKKEMQGKLTELEESLKSRQSDLDSMKPGTESYRQFQLKLIELEAAVEVQRRRFEAEFDLLQRSDMQSLFEDVVKELELYAKETGVELVLTKYTGGDQRSGPQPVVLFAAGGYDITETIINRLNAKVTSDVPGIAGPKEAPKAADGKDAPRDAGARKDAPK